MRLILNDFFGKTKLFERGNMEKEICCLLKTALLGKNEQERERAKEILSLLLKQIPEIKRFVTSQCSINPQLFRYLDKAFEKTELDVKKNLYRFVNYFDLDLEHLDCNDPADAARIKQVFVRWVKMILKRDCIDEERKHKKKRWLDIDAPFTAQKGGDNSHEIIPAPELNGIENLLLQERKKIDIFIKDYIDLDPEGKLEDCHPKKKRKDNQHDLKKCNCKILLQMYFFKKVAIKEIAQIIATPEPTLRDRLKICIKLLQKILKEEGYL